MNNKSNDCETEAALIEKVDALVTVSNEKEAWLLINANAMRLLNNMRAAAISKMGTGDIETFSSFNEKSLTAHERDKARGTDQACAAALLRIEEGTYGTCTQCNDRIPAIRMARVLTGTQCINCLRKI